MKRLVTIIAVAALLMGAAIYYRLNKENADNTVPDDPGIAKPTPTPPKPDPEPDKPDSPSTDATSEGTLTMAASVSHGYIENGKTSDQYAAIDIEAKEVEGATRPPLNLAVVVDRSGSMSGQKIRYAREAALKLVEELSSDDHLSVVTYGSHANVQLASTRANVAGKSRMRSAIQRIGASGGTNIGDGISRGFEQLSASRTEDTVNRMILLSDGHPTVGITGTSRLSGRSAKYRKSGISLTTMGVGLDYNEDLMTAMADAGAGNYYFIDKPQSSVKHFASEFKGLSTTVARNTSLELTLPEGVEIGQLYGFQHNRSGRKVTVPLAEFHAGEEKNILASLKVEGSENGKQPILDARLTYHDVTSDDDALQKVALHAVTTDDDAKLTEDVNKSVISRLQQIRVAQSMKQAMEEYKKGDRDQAQKVLRKSKRQLSGARKKYDLKDKSFGRVEKELESTADSVQSADPSSSSGKRMIKQKKERGRKIELMRSGF